MGNDKLFFMLLMTQYILTFYIHLQREISSEKRKIYGFYSKIHRVVVNNHETLNL